MPLRGTGTGCRPELDDAAASTRHRQMGSRIGSLRVPIPCGTVRALAGLATARCWGAPQAVPFSDIHGLARCPLGQRTRPGLADAVWLWVGLATMFVSALHIDFGVGLFVKCLPRGRGLGALPAEGLPCGDKENHPGEAKQPRQRECEAVPEGGFGR